MLQLLLAFPIIVNLDYRMRDQKNLRFHNLYFSSRITFFAVNFKVSRYEIFVLTLFYFLTFFLANLTKQSDAKNLLYTHHDLLKIHITNTKL